MLTPRTKQLIDSSTKSKYGKRLMSAWDNPGMTPEGIEDGLSDLSEDVTKQVAVAREAIQEIALIIMRNPIYNEYTRDELLPMIEKISGLRDAVSASASAGDVAFEAEMALGEIE